MLFITEPTATADTVRAACSRVACNWWWRWPATPPLSRTSERRGVGETNGTASVQRHEPRRRADVSPARLTTEDREVARSPLSYRRYFYLLRYVASLFQRVVNSPAQGNRVHRFLRTQLAQHLRNVLLKSAVSSTKRKEERDLRRQTKIYSRSGVFVRACVSVYVCVCVS